MTIRPATASDIPALERLIPTSAHLLSREYYSEQQTEAAIRYVFGVDSQLIADGTYYVAVDHDEIVGCGGWSWRRTLYGGDQRPMGAGALLNPVVDAARIRAFFVAGDHARQGIGGRILMACEQAAAEKGFSRLELMSTLPGVPFYRRFGFEEVERVIDTLPDATTIEFVRMTRDLRNAGRCDDARVAEQQRKGRVQTQSTKAEASMKLVWPALEYLASYVDALQRGWSPDNMRQESGNEELARIGHDAEAFLASMVDREATGAPVMLPDGSVVPRLPGYNRWMWDGEFCGRISLRWRPGTEALPPHCLGHIGYTVVPWKQRRGYATQALREVLENARGEGLRYVEITTDPDNVPSQRVIEHNGGVLFEEFVAPAALGGTRKLRYRVQTSANPDRAQIV